MGFLQGKRALVTGILSNRSIAWGIAQALRREGAELALTYVDEKLRSRVDEAAAQLGTDIVLPCDVGSDADIEKLFESLAT
jgi:enoyl-[acyl-carrier protein] reductase I